KKVVATRGEIEAGIARYYVGEDEAADVALNIEQDVEPRRVTQMLAGMEGRTQGDRRTPAPRQEERAPAPAPAIVADAVSNEASSSAAGLVSDDADIIDIDDLLGADDAIQPEVIEPIAIGEDEFAFDDEQDDLVEATVSTQVRRQESAAASALERQPTEAIETDAEPDLEDAGEQDDIAILPGAPKPAEPKRRLVDLIAVSEDDFQHAITHGKARVFEKWVAIQTRNRILNAVAIEPDLEPLLVGLADEPTIAVRPE
ncbi:MAG: hypothetical protein ACOCXA_04830, partial [Planctomycetota bacterium]